MSLIGSTERDQPSYDDDGTKKRPFSMRFPKVTKEIPTPQKHLFQLIPFEETTKNQHREIPIRHRRQRTAANQRPAECRGGFPHNVSVAKRTFNSTLCAATSRPRSLRFSVLCADLINNNKQDEELYRRLQVHHDSACGCEDLRGVLIGSVGFCSGDIKVQLDNWGDIFRWGKVKNIFGRESWRGTPETCRFQRV